MKNYDPTACEICGLGEISELHEQVERKPYGDQSHHYKPGRVSHCLHAEGESCVFCRTEPTLEEVRGLGVKPLDFNFSRDSRPTFERCADPVVDDMRATYCQRGGEYADSWALENIVKTYSRATLRMFGMDLTDEQIRLLQAAALIDVKDSRMGGPFKEDSVIDSLAYRAMYLGLVREYCRQAESDAAGGAPAAPNTDPASAG